MAENIRFRRSAMAVIKNGQRDIQAGRRVTLIGAAVNVLLTGLKFAGGWLGQSQALMADAVHSLSDLLTDAIVMIGLMLGRKAPDEAHPFGHARLETLASALVGVALVLVAVEIGYSAGKGIYLHEVYHPTWLAVWVAALSILAKEGLYQYTVRVGRRLKSPAVQANAWHHRSDSFSSMAVLIGVTAARIKPAWHILDAYAALLVSFFILKVGLDIILISLKEFTDTSPGADVLNHIERCALNVNGVIEIHDLKVRTAGGQYQMELHVVVNGRLSVVEGHRIAKQVETCLLDEVDGADQVIVHVDPDFDPGP
jgi:cation diffusion facilitator family transporter